MRAGDLHRQANRVAQPSEDRTLVQQSHSRNCKGKILSPEGLAGTQTQHREQRTLRNMTLSARPKIIALVAASAVAAGCTAQFGSEADQLPAPPEQRETIWDLFGGGANPDVTVAVNRYLWNASLDVLDFMPVEAVDPFSGVIVFGYGTPPGSSRAYRATVYVRDPALAARSLNVAIQTRGGPASLATQRAVEDAILTRARQLRLRDAQL
jgi:Domain of unknown function (DUF3576)